MTAATGSSAIVPSDRPRVRATPWNSGVSQASAWSAAGSVVTGKNVPENRNSGVIPNRKIAANRLGVFCVAENAAIGVGEGHPGQDGGRDGEHDQRRFGGAEQRRSRS